MRISCQHSRFHPIRSANGWRGGFSLVEVLVAVAILGILCGVAVNWYASASQEHLQKLVDQRNAQEIVSLAVHATLGEAPFVVGGDKRATVQKLLDGTIAKAGAWKGRTYRLNPLENSLLDGALKYVKLDGELLLYEPAGGQG